VSTPAADNGAAAALAGRVVLVTGAHGGLGAATAHACAAAGATVVLLGRRVPKLNRVYDAIARDPAGLPEPVNYPMDLAGAVFDDFGEMAGRLEAQLGRLDGVVHCAAEFAGLTPLEHAEPGAFARTLHVGVTARWWLTQACLPLLRRAPDAAVVFAVDAPAAGAAYHGAYGIAQAGQQALVAMLGAELASTPVRVHGLDPGPLRTPLRARAWVEEGDRKARDPGDAAAACVALLAGGTGTTTGATRSLRP
jgi:NAD(P)-dependent dehydrogenase (short-subunit alcohol dehydrogenase family)